MMTHDLVINGFIYLSPSLLMALAIRYLSRRILLAWFVQLPATILHEALHALVGFFTFAGPVSISIIPHRIGKCQWVLGEASFRNIRWYNAALVSLAPFLCLPLCTWLVVWRLKGEYALTFMDPVLWFIAASLLIGAWPSAQDYRLAMKSWVLVPIAGIIWYYCPVIASV